MTTATHQEACETANALHSLQQAGPASRLRESIMPLLRILGCQRQRSALIVLTDRQLRDAGIDPVLAGRGKAAAVSGATLSCLQGLR